jgi:hypothetical protein
VKNKALLPCLSFFILLVTSCKKESVPAIVGKWMNTAVYSDPAKGGHGWEPVTLFHEVVTFNADAKFHVFTDTPGSGGTYNFNGSSKDLLLRFEADQYGNTSRLETRKVESMTEDRLITVFVSPVDGMIYKMEYNRVN